MSNTPLNPDALAQLIMWKELPFGGNPDNYIRLDANAAHKVIELLKSHLAVAQPEVNSVEELVTTRAGLALANSAFNEGLSAGIKACNESLEGEPFVKPVSPYRPEVNTNGC